VVLSRADPSWHAFQLRTTNQPTAPWWALLASFGPLAAFAVLGMRRPRAERDWMLMLWVVACAGVYLLLPEFPSHALSGVTLPLSVLAVRGWQRLRLGQRLPQPLAVSCALAAVLIFTVPAALRRAADPNQAGVLGLQVLSADQAAALSYIADEPGTGGVLAPAALSMSVPGMTGHASYSGHFMWESGPTGPTVAAFFDPGLRDPKGKLRQAILVSSGAKYVVTDCGSPAALARAIAPLASQVRRFGCVTVYRRA
jgi:hypothetical protein